MASTAKPACPSCGAVAGWGQRDCSAPGCAEARAERNRIVASGKFRVDYDEKKPVVRKTGRFAGKPVPRRRHYFVASIEEAKTDAADRVERGFPFACYGEVLGDLALWIRGSFGNPDWYKAAKKEGAR